MPLIIHEDDYQEVNCHKLESNGEIEIYWNSPTFPNQWSYRHAKWAPKQLRDDPNYNRGWTKLKPVTKDSRCGSWKPYSLILKRFSLKNTDLPAEKLLIISPDWMKSLMSVVKNPYDECSHCHSKTFCQHSIGSNINDPVDDFRLICPKCGELERYTHIDMGNDPGICPWCDRKIFGN